MICSIVYRRFEIKFHLLLTGLLLAGPLLAGNSCVEGKWALGPSRIEEKA
jgi:hypothetical protein